MNISLSIEELEMLERAAGFSGGEWREMKASADREEKTLFYMLPERQSGMRSGIKLTDGDFLLMLAVRHDMVIKTPNRNQVAIVSAPRHNITVEQAVDGPSPDEYLTAVKRAILLAAVQIGRWS